MAKEGSGKRNDKFPLKVRPRCRRDRKLKLFQILFNSSVRFKSTGRCVRNARWKKLRELRSRGAFLSVYELQWWSWQGRESGKESLRVRACRSFSSYNIEVEPEGLDEHERGAEYAEISCISFVKHLCSRSFFSVSHNNYNSYYPHYYVSLSNYVTCNETLIKELHTAVLYNLWQAVQSIFNCHTIVLILRIRNTH